MQDRRECYHTSWWEGRVLRHTYLDLFRKYLQFDDKGTIIEFYATKKNGEQVFLGTLTGERRNGPLYGLTFKWESETVNIPFQNGTAQFPCASSNVTNEAITKLFYSGVLTMEEFGHDYFNV